MPLTQEELKTLFHYDPITGIFTYKKALSNRTRVGDWAGSVTSGGYKRVWIHGTTYAVHRLIWLYMTGEWPNELIDHIDGNPTNNRWNNLREATKSQNGAYSFKLDKGIRRRSSGRWEARIRVDRKEIYIGSFRTKEEAKEAFADASYRHRGEFAKP
jgi:hypothetical protein